MTLKDLEKSFGTDRKCLEYIRQQKYPVCPKCSGVLYRVRRRMSYACKLGHQVYPLKGIFFQKSTTPLHYWFHAIFLMSQTRAGVSAATLSRTTGVNYKTAWRMFKQIRTLMKPDEDKLKGVVEVDETWIGGKNYYKGRSGGPVMLIARK